MSKDFDVKEKRFEQDIEEYLITSGGYEKGKTAPLATNELRKAFRDSAQRSHDAGKQYLRHQTDRAEHHCHFIAGNKAGDKESQTHCAEYAQKCG